VVTNYLFSKTAKNCLMCSQLASEFSIDLKKEMQWSVMDNVSSEKSRGSIEILVCHSNIFKMQ
jgi:hypothetical protein